MKRKLFAGVLFLSMLFMLCSCSDPDQQAKDEIHTLITNYQAAINRGDYDAADSYCVLEDGKAGAWFFHENSVELTEATPAYLVACQELSDERFFIDVYNVDVFDDTAIVETCFYQCATPDAINELPSHFTVEEFEKLEKANVEECKEQLKDYIHGYTFMFAANVECRKINGEWKITKLN